MEREGLSGVGHVLGVGRVVDVGEGGVVEVVLVLVVLVLVAPLVSAVVSAAVRSRRTGRRTEQVGQRFQTAGQVRRHRRRLQQQVRHQTVRLGQQRHVQSAGQETLRPPPPQKSRHRQALGWPPSLPILTHPNLWLTHR